MRCRGGAAVKTQTAALIGSGAFDRFGVARSRMLEGLDDLISFVNERKRRESDAQIDLFAAAGEELTDAGFVYPELAEYPLDDLLRVEKELTGMWFSGHPLADYQTNIAQLNPTRISRLVSNEGGSAADGAVESLCCLIISVSFKVAKSGGRYAILQLEDESGGMEALVFEKALEASKEFIKKDAAVYVRGKLTGRDDEEPKLTVYELLPLIRDEDMKKIPAQSPAPATSASAARQEPQKPAAKPQKLYIRLSGDEKTDRRVRAVVEIFEGGVPCIYYDPNSKKYNSSGRSIAVSAYILEVLKTIAGEENVVLK